MTEPTVNLAIDEPEKVFAPGELLAGQYSLEGVAPGDVRAIELSVLWHTEGKGDEDLSVHFFERIDPAEDDTFDARLPRRFSTVLPNSPLSYGGMIVKIRWCARVRVFLGRGREVSREVPFQLGSVPDAVEVAT